MKAMILAAGRGERMRPLTDKTPKPLLEVGGKPLIFWHIEKLAKAGFKEVIVNNAYLGEQIEQRLGDGSRFGIKIFHSSEKNGALETAGGIANALHLLGDNPFLLVNGDVWTDWEFANAYSYQNIEDGCHLVFVDNPTQHPNGDFELFGNLVKLPKNGKKTFTYSGLGIYSIKMFNDVTIGEPAKLKPLLESSILNNLVTAEHHRGLWVDVGTPERLKELDLMLGNRA